MKTNSNKKIFFMLLPLLVLYTSCSRKAGLEDISGIYVCKYEYKYCNSLDYLVLYKDSTYKRVFIQGFDTLQNSSKWNFCPYAIKKSYIHNNASIRFEDWITYGIEKENLSHLPYYKEDNYNVIMEVGDNTLYYFSDLDIHFTKLDSISMIEYGIVESIY